MQKKPQEKLHPEKRMIQSENYQGIDRRKEDDPSYFGYFALEGLERRRFDSVFHRE